MPGSRPKGNKSAAAPLRTGVGMYRCKESCGNLSCLKPASALDSKKRLKASAEGKTLL